MNKINPDDQIIQRAQKGDPIAQGLLVKSWYKRVFNYSLRILGDYDAAMEVSQQTFITVWLKLPALKDAAKFQTWLYTILHNHCLGERRKTTNRRYESINSSSEAKGDFRADYISPSGDPESLMMDQELRLCLEKGVMELPEEQRSVLIMKEFEGLKFREIAEILGESENTVKSRLYYAFKHLRKYLNKMNINQNSFGYGE
ncbi:RNA polymerase sigma factor [Cyclobacterium amurskyense]|uniref:RNA polymerase ECF-type sigma factor n=1 Tax=Cyclobacterium amurskyense TaxID=320787 RepID=A0A0H4P9V1_9BACT|nr:RNA polymerase sigma factor [Cyclobacterium amurskyense]AKP49925.1 RNA polymerase ECF-type sigma factor [Cyclobacterium amurskyense]